MAVSSFPLPADTAAASPPQPGAPPGRDSALPLRGAVVWVLHVTLPIVGLWLLLTEPAINLRWDNQLSHFWLVALTSAASVALALLVARAGTRRRDARLVLVALSFLAGAVFLGVHALATPGVLVDRPTFAFDMATPAGLLLGAGFAAASAIELPTTTAARVVAGRVALTAAVLLLAAAWTLLTVLDLTALTAPASSGPGVLTAGAVLGAALYAAAVVRYLAGWHRRASRVSLAIATAFALLAEALVATTLGHNWHLSWWEWHLLMIAGFAFVLYASRLEARREGDAARVYDPLALDETLAAVREDYGNALEAYVDAVRHGTGGAVPVGALARRFDLTASQVDVLSRAGDALAAERDQLRRLGALVEVGHSTQVLAEEDTLLGTALSTIVGAFPYHAFAVALVQDGELALPERLCRGRLDAAEAMTLARHAVGRLETVERHDRSGGFALALPIRVRQRAAGALVVIASRGTLAPRDRAILASLTSQLSVGLENVRVYRELDGLFRSYLSPDIASALIADPAQAALGGARADVSILIADLQGFTAFSERSTPEEVVDMLNTLYSAIAPRVLAHGGTITQFIGDAIMAVFGAPARNPDHARQAAAAALDLQAAADELRHEHPGWPRFRCGVNTGAAVVGNVGAQSLRTFTVIGDTVNLAARLEGTASAGEVVVGPRTAEALGTASMTPLGPISLKGKADPVDAFRLVALEEVA